MGVKVKRVYAFAFAFGVLLAAFAGALTAPKISVQPGLSSDVIILSFAIVVIGGLGSVEGAAVGAILVGLARAHLGASAAAGRTVHDLSDHGGGADVPPRGPVPARDGKADLMSRGLHPVVMIGLVIAAALFGRVLPTWTLSLATVAASNALIALGIVVLARTGNVSFGQGLFFAAGGYGVALIANASGITDAVAQVIIGAVCGGLLGLVIGPLIARYTRHLLRHADAGAVDDAVWRAAQVGGARRLRRIQCRPSQPVRHGLHRYARGGFHAVCGVGGHHRPRRHRRDHPVPLRAWPRQPRGP